MTLRPLDGTRTAIVIPVFNGLDQLRHCINSLAWTRHDPLVQLLVVDSDSTDGTAEALAAEAPWIDVLPVGSDAWWTAAVDHGCHQAFSALGVDCVCLLNHDCQWSQEGFTALRACLAAHPDDILCSRVVERRSGEPIFVGGRQLVDGSLTTARPRTSPQSLHGSWLVDWCGGMGVMFSARTYWRVGGFDARTFPHYFGDSDFCLRGRRVGVDTRYCPESLVVNDGSSTGIQIPREGATLSGVWESLRARKSVWNLRDNVRFYVRHRGVLAPIALAHVYAIWAAISAVRLGRAAHR